MSGGGVFEEGEAGAGVVEEVAELVRGEPEVHGDGHAAELLERPVRDDVLEPISEREQDTIAPGRERTLHAHAP